MPAVVYAQEPFSKRLSEEALPLMQAHWNETSDFFADKKFAPDWIGYKHVSDSGCLRIFTARAGAALVGYAVLFVFGSMQFMGRIANSDGIYVTPSYRGGHVGVDMMRFAQDALRLESVCVVFWHSKHADGLSLGPLLKRHLGATHLEDLWAVRLDQEASV